MSDLFGRLTDKSVAISQRGGEFLQPALSAFMSAVTPALGNDEDIGQARLEYPVRPLEAVRQVETHVHETKTIITPHLTPNSVAPPQSKRKDIAPPSPSSDSRTASRRTAENAPDRNASKKAVVKSIKLLNDSKQVPILKAAKEPQPGEASPGKTKGRIPTLVSDTGPRPAPVHSVEPHIQNRGSMRAQSNQSTAKTPPAPPQLKINIGKISVTGPQPKAAIAAPIAQPRQQHASRHNLKEYLGWRR